MPDIYVQPRQWLAQPTGVPYAGAQLFFYQAGTLVQQTVYQDSGLLTPHSQPVEAGDDGKFPVIYLNPDAETDYRVISRTRFGTLIDDLDNIPKSSVSRFQIGLAIYPLTDAEADAGFVVSELDLWFRPGDVLRYRIVPNSTAARDSNTTTFKKLVSYSGTSTFRGSIWFTNTTGDDTYYLGDIIDFRDGIHIDACWSTLHFTKNAVATDSNAGFFWALRDFSITRFKIIVNYNMNGVATSAGNALAFGKRGTDGNAAYGPVWDSLLSSPMGNISVTDGYIDSNVSGGQGIFALGGIDVHVKRVKVKGNSALRRGFYGEFGWATDEADREDRQTSHGKFTFDDFEVNGLDPDPAVTGTAIAANGAYLLKVDGLDVTGCYSAVTAGTGESLFYRPWVGRNDARQPRVDLRNITGNVTGLGISVAGAVDSTGYLAPLSLGPEDETDLLDFSLESFSLKGTGVNFGVLSSAAKTNIRSGTVTGFVRGVVTTNECTQGTVETTDVFGCEQYGMQIGQDVNLYPSPRQKIFTVRNCFVAGNSTDSAGTYAGIWVADSESILLQNNRFGYEVAHDGVAETTQGAAVQVDASASGVVCKGNYVAAAFSAVAYIHDSTTTAQGCTIENAKGQQDLTGLWLNRLASPSADRGDANVTLASTTDHITQLFATTLTANRTVTLSTTNAVRGDKFRIVRTGLGSFTLDVGGLKTIGSATAAFVEVEYNGSAWFLTGYGAL